jgi:hypothetical protein
MIKSNLKLLQINILHQIDNYIQKEMLICLCERNIVFLDFEHYDIR